jgi:transposase
MKYTFLEFEKQFPDDDACLDFIFKEKYGKLEVCPKCNKEARFKRVYGRKSYQCQHTGCQHQLYPMAGTIFQKSTTPLKKWFMGMYLFTTTRNGVAAKEIERLTGVTYPTALRMAHQIKILMGKRITPVLSGEIQMDESFFGMKQSNMKKAQQEKLKKGTGYVNKIPVFGMLEKNGTIIAYVINEVNKQTLAPIILESIEPASTVVTDNFAGYKGLDKFFKKHVVINHAKQEYVLGEFHTNSIESFWSNLKRMVKGTHIKVSRKHLQKYVDEAIFRYEHRREPDTMFEVLISKIISDAA